MDIKCRRTCCKHNEGYTCCADRVKIERSTQCATFDKDPQKPRGKDFSKHMFEAAPEYANSRHIKEVNLVCASLGCLFNKEGACRANGITVIDENEHSVCGTFIQDEK